MDGIFTNGCVLFLLQGGTLKEGASKAVSVPFVHRLSTLSALPQHHSCAQMLLSHSGPSKYHHVDFNKGKPRGNVLAVDCLYGFGSLLGLKEV